MHLDEILRTAHELDASDVHLVSGNPPMIRVHTVMRALEHDVLEAEELEKALESIISEQQVRQFKESQDLDFSHEVAGLGRYRVNAHRLRNGIGLALRVVKSKVPPLSDLTLPEVISRLTYLPRGLVLPRGHRAQRRRGLRLGRRPW